MVKDGNHHHHNDPHGKEGNAYELLPDRRLPCIAPPRASTRKLEVAKNETADEWWQARLRWCGDHHLDSSWMDGDGGFWQKDDWDKMGDCAAKDDHTWQETPSLPDHPPDGRHFETSFLSAVSATLQFLIVKLRTTWILKDKPVSACFLYSRLDPVGSVQWSLRWWSCGLGQYSTVMVGTCLYWVTIWYYWLILGGIE